MFAGLAATDERILRAINHAVPNPVFDAIARAFEGPWLWIIVPFLAILGGLLLWRPRLTRAGLVVLLALPVTDFACTKIKNAVSRARPCVTLSAIRLPEGKCGGVLGFPSNHAANGMALASVMTTVGTGALGIALIPVAFLVGLSRVYAGVHYPSDVIAGFILGGVLGWLLARAVEWAVRLQQSAAQNRAGHGEVDN